MNRRRSRSRHSRSPRGRQRSPHDRQLSQPTGPFPGNWPSAYGGYGGGGYRQGGEGFNPAAWWGYGGCGGSGPEAFFGKDDRRKGKKKKKKRRRSSSSSSSSSSSDVDWRQKVWNRGWQGNMWPPMPGGPGGPMQGGQMWPWPNQQMGGPCGPGWPRQGPGSADGEDGGSSSWGMQDGGNSSWGMQGSGSRDGGGEWGIESSKRREESPPENVPIFLEPAVEEFVPVPKALLGKVIGKQAQTIIEIREKSGAFKVDARDQSTDPCQVKVAGTAEAVKKARALIMEMVESTKNKHAGSEYVEIPRAKIGMVIGPKGSQVNEIQCQTGTKIDVDFDNDPCKCYIKGPPDNVERAKKVLLTIAMQIEDDNSEYIDLPKTTSGALIGAQGSRVREFQEQSGARIDVDKTGPRCRVRLTGTKEQVANAKQLILAEVENSMPGINKQPALMPPAPVQPMVIPAHQPTSFPATLSESIARAKAAAEAVKSGLITTSTGSTPGGPGAPGALALLGASQGQPTFTVPPPPTGMPALTGMPHAPGAAAPAVVPPPFGAPGGGAALPPLPAPVLPQSTGPWPSRQW
uniref:K Homology domain-containing protein n=1 Tax=Alexandrium monilatum TaxID=311494 RepID=A0A7S4QX66_9DINO